MTGVRIAVGRALGRTLGRLFRERDQPVICRFDGCDDDATTHRNGQPVCALHADYLDNWSAR